MQAPNRTSSQGVPFMKPGPVMRFQLDKDSRTPIYDQVREQLISALHIGRLQAGAKLALALPQPPAAVSQAELAATPTPSAGQIVPRAMLEHKASYFIRETTYSIRKFNIIDRYELLFIYFLI